MVFCQAEDGIRDLVRSRGLGDVYKRQVLADDHEFLAFEIEIEEAALGHVHDAPALRGAGTAAPGRRCAPEHHALSLIHI